MSNIPAIRKRFGSRRRVDELVESWRVVREIVKV